MVLFVLFLFVVSTQGNEMKSHMYQRMERAIAIKRILDTMVNAADPFNFTMEWKYDVWSVELVSFLKARPIGKIFSLDIIEWEGRHAITKDIMIDWDIFIERNIMMEWKDFRVYRSGCKITRSDTTRFESESDTTRFESECYARGAMLRVLIQDQRE